MPALLSEGWVVATRLRKSSQSTKLLEKETERIRKIIILEEVMDPHCLCIVSIYLVYMHESCYVISLFVFSWNSWLKGLEVDDRKCEVNLSNVVMAHGKGYVNGKVRCALCGFQTGMKAKCANENCRARGERRTPYYFHVSCAREAGFEVSHDDENNHGTYLVWLHWFSNGCSFLILCF